MNIDELISSLTQARDTYDGSMIVVVNGKEASQIRFESENDAVVIE